MSDTIRWLLRLLAPYRWRVLLGSLLVALTVLGNAGLLATSGLLLSKAALTPEVLLLMPLITGVRFFGIGRAVVRYVERLLNHSVAFRILGHLRRDFYDHLEPLVPDALPDYAEGKLYNQFVTDINVLQYFYLKAVSVPLGSLIIYTVCALFLAFYQPVLIPLLLVGQILAGIVVPVLALSGGRAHKHEAALLQTALSEQFLDAKHGLADLHLFGRLEAVQQALTEKAEQLTLLHARMSLKKKLVSRLTFALSHLSMLAALWLMVPAVQDGALAGVYVAMLALLVLASYEAILQMPEAVLQMDESLAAAEEMRQVYETPTPQRKIKSDTLPQSFTLTAEHVRFNYHQEGRRFIEDLNLEIPAGQHVAIVGESGSGKSSLARLFSGLWQPDGGSVRIGGVDIASLDEETLHRIVASVDQESYFFYTSIRENMQLANVRVSDDAIWQALEMVELDEIVRALPQGLDTILSENARAFSGGQRQRAWIAMALAQDTPLILLDEPTTYLDMAHQLEVLELLKTLNTASQKTIALVIHDLNLAARFSDWMIAMRDGVVRYEGTAAQVMTREVLADVFMLDAYVVPDPWTGRPTCISYKMLEAES